MTKKHGFIFAILVSLLFLGGVGIKISKADGAVLHDGVFFHQGPQSAELDSALAEAFPHWSSFRQSLEWRTEPASVGEIIKDASFDLDFDINPAVTLVTVGMLLDWQLPSDGDLYSLAHEVAKELNSLYYDYYFDRGGVQVKYPEVHNPATYALYAFFNYDQQQLENWSKAYYELFDDDASRQPDGTTQLDVLDIAPFLQYPFENPPDTFYAVNSFFDHRYPMYDEEEEKDSENMYRFDGEQYESDDVNGVSYYSGHDGYDYDTPRGLDIFASAAGVVIEIQPRFNGVIIDHGNGLASSYLHLDSIDPAIGVGTPVARGQRLGEAGDTGSSGQVHLHFGIRDVDDRSKDVDPFGWWDPDDPDPHAERLNGMESAWLWWGDEAGDGYLTVDNRETQTQLFRHAYIDWHRVEGGYRGEAWYAILDPPMGDGLFLWGIWGTYISDPGYYQVQAYWPADDSGEATTAAEYKIYRHNSGTDVDGLEVIEVTADQSSQGDVWVTLGEFYFQKGPTIVILSDVTHDPDEEGKRVYFDAIRWQAVPPTPTPTHTPTNTPTDTPTPTSTPTPTPTSTPTPTPTPIATPLPSRGFYPDGILASYYNDQDDGQWVLDGPITWETFTQFVLSRTETEIAFDLQSQPPAPGVNGTFWSARWVGQLLVPATGDYIFYFDDLDDGARLYIDGGLILESWLVQGAHDYQSNPFPLTAGLHEITVEYAQGPLLGSSFYLSWSSPFFPKELIGPAGVATPTPTPTPTSQPCPLTWLKSQDDRMPDLGLFYRLRDFLARSPQGQRYIELYNAHSADLLKLLADDPALRTETVNVLNLWAPHLKAFLDAKGAEVVISVEQVQALRAFVEHLTEVADGELQSAVQEEIARVPWDTLPGATMNQAWSIVTGQGIGPAPAKAEATPTPGR